MSQPLTAPVGPVDVRERVLGVVDHDRPGPMVFMLGSLHGNEPAGVLALERVLSKLADGQIPLAGRLVALAGNLGALARGERYLDRDLNRMWLADEVDALRRRSPHEDCAEEHEMTELLAAFDEYSVDRGGETVVVDLHSISAEGAPFCLIGDTVRNRTIAFELALPVLLGLEEAIDGALLDHMNRRGFITVGVEGGRHDDPATIDHLESVTWLTLRAASAIAEDAVDLESHRRRLRAATRDLPEFTEILLRHAITVPHEFVMQPGFKSFDPVERDQLLARDQNGEIRAPFAGLMLMPLYQGKGDDGFFLGRPVRPLWLWLSAVMRRIGADRLIQLLPGVRRHPQQPDALLVDASVARWQVNNIFHLFGYRRYRPCGDRLVFSRRRER